MVPASAATLLDQAGYDVIWDDAIAEMKDYDVWLRDLEKHSPDIVMIETKTPVVKSHWKIIGDVKRVLPDVRTILVGDHVTALPAESMERSEVDHVLCGGDFDFLLLDLVEYLDGKRKHLEPGIWSRNDTGIQNTGPFQLRHKLDSLPFVNRDLTKWRLYAYKNGNFKRTPGTYTMVGRDCWYRKKGGCFFCSWPTLYPAYRVRSPQSLVEELEALVAKYQVREVFDDTGTFPVGEWLRKFCNLVIDRKLNEKIHFSCNMRFGALSLDDYRLMKRAGFRMLLFGLESASQLTLDRLNKGIAIDDTTNGCKWAREAGLEPHITIMVGYPWETREDALTSLRFARMLMEKGWALTLQSTIVIPYPGTRLYDEALEKEWFRIDPKEYERFDMSEPVLNVADMTPQELVEICDSMYKIFLSPKYVLKQLGRMNSFRDVAFTARGFMKVLGHLKDFAKK